MERAREEVKIFKLNIWLFIVGFNTLFWTHEHLYYQILLKNIKYYPHLFYGTLFVINIFLLVYSQNINKNLTHRFKDSVFFAFCILWGVSWFLGYEAGDYTLFKKNECFRLVEIKAFNVHKKHIKNNSPIFDGEKSIKEISKRRSQNDYKVLNILNDDYVVIDRKSQVRKIHRFYDVKANPIQCLF